MKKDNVVYVCRHYRKLNNAQCSTVRCTKELQSCGKKVGLWGYFPINKILTSIRLVIYCRNWSRNLLSNSEIEFCLVNLWVTSRNHGVECGYWIKSKFQQWMTNLNLIFKILKYFFSEQRESTKYTTIIENDVRFLFIYSHNSLGRDAKESGSG